MSRKRFDVDAFLARYDALDAAVVAAGYHPTSRWWRKHLERLLRARAHGAILRWIIRAGRRAGKSSTLCRLAVAWVLWGPWSIHRGDTAVVAFVSVDRREAGARIRTIADILDVIGIRYDQRDGEIELRAKGRPVLFRVVTCSLKGTVGFTSIMVIGDEVARWDVEGANPARHNVASLAPTLATQAFGLLILSSSPWSTDDYHAELFDTGDTEHQIVSFAPTWVANPSLTEDDTRALEPDGPTWEREYAAIPGAVVSGAIDPADHVRCYGRVPTGKPVRGFANLDSSKLLGNDTFAVNYGYISSSGQVVVAEIEGWDGAKQREVDIETIVRHIAKRARSWRARVVFGDPYESLGLVALFSQAGVPLRTFNWTAPEKETAMQLIRRWMREGTLLLPDHAELRKQFTNLKARLLPSGQLKYETNGKDYASTVITLAMASAAGALPGSRPQRKTLLRVLGEMTPRERAKLIRRSNSNRIDLGDVETGAPTISNAEWSRSPHRAKR